MIITEVGNERFYKVYSGSILQIILSDSRFWAFSAAR